MVKTFDHKPLPVTELIARTSHDGTRVYVLPDGTQLPSVTTVLKRTADTTWLERWIEKVGKEKAEQISFTARQRGTAIHTLAENFLKNDPEWEKTGSRFALADFRPIAELLEQHVSTVYGLEYPTFSKRLGVAGRVDLICDWDGVPTVGDFKTSRRMKRASEIIDYFLQAGCYATMIRESGGLNIQQVAIILAVEHESPVLFRRPLRDLEVAVERVFGRATADCSGETKERNG